jgi:hypothetical protein
VRFATAEHPRPAIASLGGTFHRNWSSTGPASATHRRHLRHWIFCATSGGDAIDQALHTGAEVFETDRWRQNSLILDGWCVLRFTWTMIEEQPEKVIAMVREAIEMLAKQS